MKRVYIDHMIYAYAFGPAEQQDLVRPFFDTLTSGVEKQTLLAPWSVAHLSELLPISNSQERLELLGKLSRDNEISNGQLIQRSPALAFHALKASNDSQPKDTTEAFDKMGFMQFREALKSQGFDQAAFNEAEKKGINPFQYIEQRLLESQASPPARTEDPSALVARKNREAAEGIVLAMRDAGVTISFDDALAMLLEEQKKKPIPTMTSFSMENLKAFFAEFLINQGYPNAAHPVLIDMQLLDTFNFASDDKKEKQKRKGEPYWSEKWDPNHVREALACDIFVSRDNNLLRRLRASLHNNNHALHACSIETALDALT